MKNNMKTAQILEANGLNWEVKKEPLFLNDGVKTDYFAMVRQDNRRVLASVGKNYAPFQNADMIYLLEQMCGETETKIHKAGLLSDGKKVFVQMTTPIKLDGIGDNKDTVNFFATCLNSHDGTTPLSWGNTSVTISCMNTFVAGMRSMRNNGGTSVRHSQGTINPLLESIRQYQRGFGDALESSKRISDGMYFMSKAKFTKSQTEKFIKTVFGVDFTSDQEVNAKRYNRAVTLRDAIMSEMAQKGETAWGAFNGVTKFTTHLSNRNQSVREASKMVGTNLSLDNYAYKVAHDMASTIMGNPKQFFV